MQNKQNKIISKNVVINYEVLLPSVTIHKIPVTKFTKAFGSSEVVVHLGFDPNMDIGYQIIKGLTDLGIINSYTEKVSFNKKAQVVKIELDGQHKEKNQIVSENVVIKYEVLLPSVTMHKIPVNMVEKKIGDINNYEIKYEIKYEIILDLGVEPGMDIGYQIIKGLKDLCIINRDTTKISVNKKAPIVKIEREKKVLHTDKKEEQKSLDDFFKEIQEQLSGNKNVISSKPEGLEAVATEVRSEEEFKKLIYILKEKYFN